MSIETIAVSIGEWLAFFWSYYYPFLMAVLVVIKWLLISASVAAGFIAVIYGLAQPKFWEYFFKAIRNIFPGLFSLVVCVIPMTLKLIITNFYNVFGKEERTRSYIFELFWVSVRNTYRCKVVGIILKLVTYVLLVVGLVVGVVASICLPILPAIVVSFGIGAFADKKSGQWFKSLFIDVNKCVEVYDRCYARIIDDLKEYTPSELKKGARKFDINPFYAVSAMVTLVFTAVITIPFACAVTLFHTPFLVWQATKKFVFMHKCMMLALSCRQFTLESYHFYIFPQRDLTWL